MLLNLVRNFCLIGLPLLLMVAAGVHFLSPSFYWAEAVYIIALTANIGYFTNFIAIKMLFKPYHRTALGRQGLIPQNQPKLASALSATLSDHFLASEHWQEYLQNANLIEKLMTNSEQFITHWLSQPENQKELAGSLQAFLEENQQSIQIFFEEIQQKLILELGEKIDPQKLLSKSFEWVETQFEQRPREMEFLIEPVVKTVAENIPLIAQRLHDTLDDHIENQDTIRRGIAKAAKWSANITEDDIKRYLFRMVASFEFRQTLFEGLQTLVSEYKYRHDNPNDETPHLDFSTLVNDFIHHQTNSFNIAKYLQVKLQDPDIIERAIKLLYQSISPTCHWLKHKIDTPKVNQAINQQLVTLIEHIDLREIIEEKAAGFSPQKMESIFHTMIKEQLVFIELLGALLGGLSGLALINFQYFSILTILLASYYALDTFLTHIKSKALNSKEILDSADSQNI